MTTRLTPDDRTESEFPVPDPVPTTPLRALPHSVVDGVRVVRETGAAWLDGSEGVLYERMTSGLPLDSLSDELFATATNWPEQYHLSPSRANVIRALDLPPEAAVLEIGCGCGAITRYLGEACATVDALEPTFARARVAAARTAELPGVTVINAEVDDLPQEPAYDLVVVVGVLEYVGNGGADEAPYVEFLERLRATLRPGGRLVLAIENELGVKYLAGAPEDHSNEVFHSVQGYVHDGPARTFSRRRLVQLMTAAGYTGTRVLGAFPDYKLTRIVLDDSLLEHAPGLAVNAPHFPSPDWVTPRPVLLDEGSLWQELVTAGVGGDFSNSFLVVAGTDGPEAPALWADDQLARYFSMRRRRPFQVAKTVTRAADEVTITSRRLGSGTAGAVTVLPYGERWEEGESLVDRIVREPATLDAEVAVWADLFRGRAAASAEGTPFDVLPHNIHYVDGQARIIDDEWRSTSLTAREATVRGGLLLARDLLDEAPLDVWGESSATALVQRIAAAAGEVLTEEDVESAIRTEAELQATIGGAAEGTPHHARIRRAVEAELRRNLDEPTYGVAPAPLWRAESDALKEAVSTRDLLFATGDQLGDARAEAERLQAELAQARAEVAELNDHPARLLVRRTKLRVRGWLPGRRRS